MTAVTLTLADFLTARFDEEQRTVEAVIAAAVPVHFGGDPNMDWPDGTVSWDGEITGTKRGSWAMQIPAHRVLADIAAKRRVIALHYDARSPYCCPICSEDDYAWDGQGETMVSSSAAFPCDTVKALAQPFAEHPDFRPEWLLPG